MLAWLPAVLGVNVHLATNQLIHITMEHIPTRRKWCCTIVYGSNDQYEREVLWDDLCKIGDSTN